MAAKQKTPSPPEDATLKQRKRFWKKVRAKANETLKELDRRLPKARRSVKEAREKVADLKARKGKIRTSPGAPHYSGSDDIIRNEVDPVAARYGAPVTSRKRAANHPLTISNPGSDHSELAIHASAADYGTYTGHGLAHAIAKALGISSYSTGNYNRYTIVRDGRTYSVQILWAVSGHYNHVHVGIRWVG